MAHGDGAAIHVHPGRVDVEITLGAHHHCGEGFVDLEQVDVLGAHLGLGQGLLGSWADASEHDGGFRTDDRRLHDAGTGLQPQLLAHLLVADQHQSGAIDDAGTVAGVMHVVDLFQRRVLAQHRGVKAHLAHGLEAGLERAQAFQRGIGTDEFVVVQHGEAVDVLDRHQ